MLPFRNRLCVAVSAKIGFVAFHLRYGLVRSYLIRAIPYPKLTLEALQGATGSVEFLRRKDNLRYVWLYSIVDYLCSTSYHTNIGGSKPKEQYEKEMANWKPLHTVWKQHRREFQARLALTPQDKAILAQILPGMKVKFSPRTPVTKNKPQ